MSEPQEMPGAGPDAVPTLVAELEAAVRLEEGESLERAYVFEPVERGGVSFTLTLVTKRLAQDLPSACVLAMRSTIRLRPSRN